MIRELSDAPARQIIRQALDRTVLVEAAAGTGKTSELVGRIVAVILSGRARLSSIAAVTFTEKAAGEMKLRIRTELDRALFDESLPPEARQHARAGLRELETAKVGTIHAFCGDMLREHPAEAGVDPRFEVADGERSRRLLERAFDRWFEHVLRDPPEGVRRILQRKRVDPRGAPARQQLMAAAARLIETRDFDTPYRRDPFERAAAIADMFAELHALALLAEQGRERDPLTRSLGLLARKLDQAGAFDLDAREEFLRRLARDRDDVWTGPAGRGDLYGPELARGDAVAARASVKARLDVCVSACEADLAACLSRELTGVVAAYEREKATLGLLDFFDLLLVTRRLLQEVPTIRRELQASLSHVFVDEFQDTDPVQSEIVLLLAADDPHQCDPWQCRALPGKLFVVGDPKQSIYRFRRADISLYERVKRQLVAGGAEVVQLSTSFRALPGIQACVNAAFAPRMDGDPGVGQAEYVALASFRAERPNQPSLVALPAPQPYGRSGRVTKTAINASLPGAVAAWIEWLVQRSGYVVSENGCDVPVEARHVCLLFRRFRSYTHDLTRDYIRALEARRLPHVMSGGRSFHTREEVIAIRNAMTAIEWPDDALHVYATLRGPFVALSDETLFSFKTRAGHLHPLGPIALERLGAAEREVADALQLLARLHVMRNRKPIAETLSAFLHALRAHAGIAIWPTGEQALGNVLQMLDFARSYERRADASSFRGFVEWLDRQAAEGETPDASVVEERSDGVRIMTVHAAKGLEFPVVVLCDPTAPKRPEHASRYIDPERKLWAQSLCDATPIELLEQREQVRDHDAAEIVRLAYVAATRAKELLVVPACGDKPIEGWLDLLVPALYPTAERSRSPERSSLCLPEFGRDSVCSRADHIPDDSVAPGEHLPRAGQHRVVWWDPNVLDLERPSAGGVAQHDLLQADEQSGRDEAGLLAYRAWSEAGASARAGSACPSLVVQTITAAAADETLEVDVASVRVIERQTDRAARPSGPRFGTLVHALIAQVELGAQPEVAGLEALGRALGRSLSASTLEIARAVVEVREVLAHPFFERVRSAAVRGELHRETAVTMRTPDGVVLDGVVDMVFQERAAAGARLVLIDFKTDVAIGDLRPYCRQLALYAAGLGRALALPVESVLFRI